MDPVHILLTSCSLYYLPGIYPGRRMSGVLW